MANFLPFRGILLRDPSLYTPADLQPEDASITEFRKLPFHSSNLLYPEDLNDFPRSFNQIIKQYYSDTNKKFFFSCRQQFTDPLSQAFITREGILGLFAVRNGRLLTHEHVVSKDVERLKNYFLKTGIQGNPAMGFYADERNLEAQLLKESLENPVLTARSKTEVFSIGLIDEGYSDILNEIVEQNEIFLADGHHRLAALKSTGIENAALLITLFNEKATPLKAYPIHRLISFSGLSQSSFEQKLNESFIVNECDESSDFPESGHAYKLILKNKTLILTLKADIDSISWNFPEVIKNLDHTIIHYYIIEKCLGIKGKEQKKNSENIKFCSIFTDCVKAVKEGLADAAVIVKNIDLEVIKKVAKSGYSYPQKSTYFYPKPLSGLLFAPVILNDKVVKQN